ncbi:hypothetical protein [Labrenzia sp. 011]|uniref:hypothetical protein n=1 Tax=Labrenzia sp. 011 TaxID=2171494 RepID=UPI0010573003|nr:hypothetical protein [Labrenzia sp. 011]
MNLSCLAIAAISNLPPLEFAGLARHQVELHESGKVNKISSLACPEVSPEGSAAIDTRGGCANAGPHDGSSCKTIAAFLLKKRKGERFWVRNF